MISNPPGHLTASRIIRLLAMPLLTALGGLPAEGPVARAETPPPIPSLEARARLIAAEREAGAVWRIPAPREVHDEYDVLHYDISLGFDIPNEIINGTVSASVVLEIPDPSQIDIDLYECMTVDAVTIDGDAAFYTREDGVLAVSLPGVYQQGDTIEVSSSYHGVPDFPGQPLPFRWQTQNGVPMVLTYSEPYGAPAWWMCKDDPKDKATYDIHLTVPDTLIAISNGLLDSVLDNGDGTETYNWSTDYAMSTYLFSLAVTNFDSWTEVYTALDGETTMDVTYWAYPADFADAQVCWSRNLEMMEYYVGIFGEYPFLDEKYDIAEFQHPGAMEHQTCTSMGWTWIDGTHANDFVVAHELSHSWVGNMITMTEWSHAWCKEGFATYCEALYFEDMYGENYYHSYMNGLGDAGYYVNQLYNIDPPLHGAIYYKGAWVFHMLRHVIGDNAFFDAIRSYVDDQSFRYGVADTDDMCVSFEETTGIELSWFFDQWIYRPGFPYYEVGWSAQAAGGGYDVAVAVSQVQEIGPIFKMPIDIKVVTYQGSETFVVWDSLGSQVFDLHVQGQPLAVVLDPDHWLIRQVQPMGIGPEEQPPIGCLASNHPNPFKTKTVVDFFLPRAGRVGVDVYDSGGRRVARLFEGNRFAGNSSVVWNGTDARGRPVAPGVYHYRLWTPEGQATGRMLRVR